MILEIQAYGDFDIKQTKCIYELPNNTNVKKLLEDFYNDLNLENCGPISPKGFKKPTISTNGIQGLRDNNNILKLFYNWLNLKGYKLINTHKVCFTD